MLLPGLVTFEDNRDKADYMTREAIRDARLPWVRHWAGAFLRLPPSRRAPAILEFCQIAIAYVRDPREEVLEDADTVLERGGGDCDAKQRLLVALCTACGIPARALPVFRGDQFPHVLAELYLGGRWLPADPTIINSGINAIPPPSQAVTNYG
jgi:hypothetical protein